MRADAVETHDLTKTYGPVVAVDSLNLTIRRGELFGLLGPNGSGKTTTVRMLCSLIEPTRGTATVAGFDIRKNPEEVRKRIGVVSDGVLLYRDLTVEENLNFLASMYDLPATKARSRIQELLELFEFGDRARRIVGTLSSGLMKKALVAAALLHEPEVLFLDEVTSGLDPQSSIALRHFTIRLCEAGVTVIWTTHIMEEPEKLCDRVGVIFGGHLIQIGSPSELRRSVDEARVLEVEVPGLQPNQISLIEKAPGVLKVTYSAPKLRVAGASDDEDFLSNVTRILASSGAKIKEIASKEPTLEEAFITLTGGEEKSSRLMEKSR